MSDTDRRESPVIHRCEHCGGLVHPGDSAAAAAWCSRCRRIVPTVVDGGAA